VSAPSDTKLQFNFKTAAGDLHNVYAVDEEEAHELLEAFGRLVGKTAEISQLLRTASGAAQTLSTGSGFGGVPAQAGPPPQEVYAPPVTAAGGTPNCVHGPMIERSAKAGAARQWKAYFCNTPQGTPNQCKPIDAKTGKPWG
jgi:hypothetical protein